MAKNEEAFEVEGTVTAALANTRFRVQLETGPKSWLTWLVGCERTLSVLCPAIRFGWNFLRTT